MKGAKKTYLLFIIYNSVQSSSCIALTQKKKKVWRNDYALEPVNSLGKLMFRNLLLKHLVI